MHIMRSRGVDSDFCSFAVHPPSRKEPFMILIQRVSSQTPYHPIFISLTEKYIHSMFTFNKGPRDDAGYVMGPARQRYQIQAPCPSSTARGGYKVDG